MEVKVNSSHIVAERRKRAWSQQHLATAAGSATLNYLEDLWAGV